MPKYTPAVDEIEKKFGGQNAFLQKEEN